MPTRPRYASNTTVSVQSSRGEIVGILTKYGVERMGWESGPEGDALLFELEKNRYRFTITKPSLADIRTMYPNTRDEWAKQDAEYRRRWRATVLLLKAKLEFIDSGDTDVIHEFLPYLLVSPKQTLSEWIDSGEASKVLPMLSAGVKNG